MAVRLHRRLSARAAGGKECTLSWTRKRGLSIVAFVLLWATAAGCAQSGNTASGTPESATDGVPALVCGVAIPPEAPSEPLSGPPVTVADRTGFVWDISTAVYAYGFEADGFDHGLGVGAIPPIDDPEFLEPRDPDYPDPDDDFDVIGVDIAGEERAYRVRAAASHEIVNDRVGGVHLSVGY